MNINEGDCKCSLLFYFDVRNLITAITADITRYGITLLISISSTEGSTFSRNFCTRKIMP